MKILMLSFAFAILGCTSRPVSKHADPASIQSISQLRPGLTTEAEVKSKFGTPSKVSQQNELIRWEYLDEATGVPRLFADFKSNHVLNAVILMAFDMAEKDLQIAKSHFPNAKFKINRKDSGTSHYIWESENHIADKEGVTIFAEGSFKKTVTAIAWFAPETTASESRNPSSH